jgi:hypothetical protein
VGVRVFVKKTRRTPLYNIGVASRLCGISIHRLRWVERAGSGGAEPDRWEPAPLLR